ncbi:hypothetical protein ACTA71_003403 [Dictyostelium dimigraforme]
MADNFKILFYRVIHNKYLFNQILKQIENTNWNNYDTRDFNFCGTSDRRKFKHIDSLKWMVSNKEISLLKSKLYNKEFVEIGDDSIGILFHEMMVTDNGEEYTNDLYEIFRYILDNNLIRKEVQYTLLPTASRTNNFKIIQILIDKKEESKNNKINFYNNMVLNKIFFEQLFYYSSVETVDKVLKNYCLDLSSGEKSSGNNELRIKDSIMKIIKDMDFVFRVEHINNGIVECLFNYNQLKQLIIKDPSYFRLDSFGDILKNSEIKSIILDQITPCSRGGRLFKNLFSASKIKTINHLLILIKVFNLYFTTSPKVVQEEKKKIVPETNQALIEEILNDQSKDEKIKFKELFKYLVLLTKQNTLFKNYLFRFEEPIDGIDDQFVLSFCFEAHSTKTLKFLIEKGNKIKAPNVSEENCGLYNLLSPPLYSFQRIIEFYNLYSNQNLIVSLKWDKLKSMVDLNSIDNFKSILESEETTTYIPTINAIKLKNKNNPVFQFIKPLIDHSNHSEPIIIKEYSTIDWVFNNPSIYCIYKTFLCQDSIYFQTYQLADYSCKKLIPIVFQSNETSPSKLYSLPFVKAISDCNFIALDYFYSLNLYFNTFSHFIKDYMLSMFKDQTEESLVNLFNFLNNKGYDGFSENLIDLIIRNYLKLRNNGSNNGNKLITFNFNSVTINHSIGLLIQCIIDNDLAVIELILNNLLLNLDVLNAFNSNWKKINFGRIKKLSTHSEHCNQFFKSIEFFLNYFKSVVPPDLSISGELQIMVENSINYFYQQSLITKDIDIKSLKRIYNSILEHHFNIIHNDMILFNYLKIKSFKLSNLFSTIAKCSICKINFFDQNIINFHFIIENENVNTILDTMVNTLFKFDGFVYQDEYDSFYNTLFGYLIQIREYDIFFKYVEIFINEQNITKMKFKDGLIEGNSFNKNYSFAVTLKYLVDYSTKFESIKRFIILIDPNQYYDSMLEIFISLKRIDLIEYLFENYKIHISFRCGQLIFSICDLRDFFPVKQFLEERYKSAYDEAKELYFQIITSNSNNM